MLHWLEKKRLEGISDLRDESDRIDRVRIVIELKRDANAQVVLNQLYKKHTNARYIWNNNVSIGKWRTKDTNFKTVFGLLYRPQKNSYIA